MALVLVGGAILARRALDGEPVLSAGGDEPVWCEPALEDACVDAYGDRVELVAPGVIADRIAAGEELDGLWVTSPAWFAAAESTGARTQVSSTSGPIVHSSLVILATAATAADCDEQVSLVCLADPGLRLDLGLDPRSTSVGLESYGWFVAAELGRAGFATNDLGGDLATWRRSFDATVDTASVASPAYAVFLARRGTYDAVVTTSAALASLGRDVEGTTTTEATTQVAVAALGSARLERVDDLTDALVGAGWSDGPGPDIERPSPAVLLALR